MTYETQILLLSEYAMSHYSCGVGGVKPLLRGC